MSGVTTTMPPVSPSNRPAQAAALEGLGDDQRFERAAEAGEPGDRRADRTRAGMGKDTGRGGTPTGIRREKHVDQACAQRAGEDAAEGAPAEQQHRRDSDPRWRPYCVRLGSPEFEPEREADR